MSLSPSLKGLWVVTANLIDEYWFCFEVRHAGSTVWVEHSKENVPDVQFWWDAPLGVRAREKVKTSDLPAVLAAKELDEHLALILFRDSSNRAGFAAFDGVRIKLWLDRNTTKTEPAVVIQAHEQQLQLARIQAAVWRQRDAEVAADALSGAARITAAEAALSARDSALMIEAAADGDWSAEQITEYIKSYQALQAIKDAADASEKDPKPGSFSNGMRDSEAVVIGPFEIAIAFDGSIGMYVVRPHKPLPSEGLQLAEETMRLVSAALGEYWAPHKPQIRTRAGADATPADLIATSGSKTDVLQISIVEQGNAESEPIAEAATATPGEQNIEMILVDLQRADPRRDIVDARILEAIKAAGGQGATLRSIASAAKRHRTNVAKRLSRLAELGLVAHDRRNSRYKAA